GDLFAEFDEAIRGLLLLVDYAQPTKPLVLIGASPQRCIARPQSLNFSICIPIVKRGFDRVRKGLRQKEGLAVDVRRHCFEDSISNANRCHTLQMRLFSFTPGFSLVNELPKLDTE